METTTRENVETGLAEIRVILGAMNGGVLIFTFVALYLVTSGTVTPGSDPANRNLLIAVLAILAVSEVVSYHVLRAASYKRLREEWGGREADADAAEQLVKQLTTLRLIGAAMAVSVGFFAIVLYLLTGMTALLVVPAVVIFLMLGLRPTFDDFRGFAADVTGRPWS